MNNNKFTVCLFVVILAVVFEKSDGHSYSLGNCPIVEPMPDFNINRMLGIWYVIQKTSTASFCITYNFTKLNEPGHYLLEQTSQHFLLGLTPFKHEYHYTGYVKASDPAVPGQMKVKFPLNVLGSASFTVFMTDYENYAGIFTCQSFGLGHRKSATILSRSKSLDKVFTDKVRTRLSSYNIDPFDLSIVSQKECPQRVGNNSQGLNIDINPHTFSSENVAGVVRTAGEKIGDGIEYVAGGAKKVYNTFTANNDKPEDLSGGKIDKDAEFINVNSYRSQRGSLRLTNEESESATRNWLP